MKKIIGDLLYDTADATCIAGKKNISSGGLGVFGQTLLAKRLYMTKKGRFFFYTRSLSSSWFWIGKEEDIIPCTEDEAKLYCMKWNYGNFKAIWGDKIERA